MSCKQYITCFFALALNVMATASEPTGFELVTLGETGGIKDGATTAFLLRSMAENNYVVLDAGTLVNGINVAVEKGAFNHLQDQQKASGIANPVGYILKERVKGYMISHPHLDHVNGLIIVSPDDSKKPIYGLPSVTRSLTDTYFNWVAWPNFSTEGKKPTLGKYAYVHPTSNKALPVDGTELTVRAYPLSHAGMESTAFLLRDKYGKSVVYLGDVGPDAVEKSDKLQQLWQALAPEIKAGRLKGMVIETSFTNETPDHLLFGHLTPKWLLHELTVLESLAGKGSLKGLEVVVSHVKYSLDKGDMVRDVIAGQLKDGNTLGVEFTIPDQGEVIVLGD